MKQTEIVVDIETIPGQAPWITESIDVPVPGNYKKPESIQKWKEDVKPGLLEEQYSRCGLAAETGEIICIGVAVGDKDPMVFQGPEIYILTEFMNLIRDIKLSTQEFPKLIGHNLIAFDLPFIYRRCLVNGVKMPYEFKKPAELKPWDSNIVDTMVEWCGLRGHISLDKLCKVFGLESKGDITGKDVWPLYQAGKLAEIVEYCKHDVSITREVYRRLCQ